MVDAHSMNECVIVHLYTVKYYMGFPNYGPRATSGPPKGDHIATQMKTIRVHIVLARQDVL